jgi:hypothetical protein
VDVPEVAPFAGRFLWQISQHPFAGQSVAALAWGLDKAGRFRVHPMGEDQVGDDTPGKETIGVVGVAEETLALSGRGVLPLPQQSAVAAKAAPLVCRNQNVGAPIMLAVTVAARAIEALVNPKDDRFSVAGQAASRRRSGKGGVAALTIPLDRGMGRGHRAVHEEPLASRRAEDDGQRQDNSRSHHHPVTLAHHLPASQ